MITALLHGIALAFGLILPLGPQNTFIFTQGATQPKLSRALVTATMAALCDTALILIAALGVSVVVLAVPWVKSLLVVGGVLFLFYIGWTTWKSADEAEKDMTAQTNWSLKRQIIFTLSISLLNPHAILDTIGVIGTSSLSYTGTERIAFLAACVSVSWIWFFGLATIGKMVGTFAPIRKHLPRVSAVIIWISALYLAYSLGVRR